MGLRELEEMMETEAEAESARVCSPELQRSSTSPIRLSLDIGFNVAKNGHIAIVQQSQNAHAHGQAHSHEAIEAKGSSKGKRGVGRVSGDLRGDDDSGRCGCGCRSACR